MSGQSFAIYIGYNCASGRMDWDESVGIWTSKIGDMFWETGLVGRGTQTVSVWRRVQGRRCSLLSNFRSPTTSTRLCRESAFKSRGPIAGTSIRKESALCGHGGDDAL